MTPISGGAVGGGGSWVGATTTGALAGGSLELGVTAGLGGTVALVDGIVTAVGEIVVGSGSSTPDRPPERLDISKSADTRIAITAAPMAPIAIIATVVRYQGSGESYCSSA